MQLKKVWEKVLKEEELRLGARSRSSRLYIETFDKHVTAVWIAESETGHGLRGLRLFCSQPSASDLKLSTTITFGPSSHKLQACTISGVPIRCTKCSYRLLQGGYPGDEVGSRTLNAVARSCCSQRWQASYTYKRQFCHLVDVFSTYIFSDRLPPCEGLGMERAGKNIQIGQCVVVAISNLSSFAPKTRMR